MGPGCIPDRFGAVEHGIDSSGVIAFQVTALQFPLWPPPLKDQFAHSTFTGKGIEWAHALRSTAGVRTMNNGMTTVFYVDDNARSRRWLSSVLTECGFEVIAAADPVEALRRCKKPSFDSALVDYQMLSLTGSRLAQEINFIAPDIPVVLISGYTVLPPSASMVVDVYFGQGASYFPVMHCYRITASIHCSTK